MPTIIQNLLERRNATIQSWDEPSEHRANAARAIIKDYPTFDQFRDQLAQGSGNHWFHPENKRQQKVWEKLFNLGFARRNRSGKFAPERKPGAIEFLTGGWLEDLSREAILAAGADAALPRAKIEWEVDGFRGHNELDVIARKDQRLIFFSCKCAKATLDGAASAQGARLRNKLMTYLHEADNLVDHFGERNDIVALVVTTDLIDEAANRVRYPSLFGKARALDVKLITLDDMNWRSLVERMRAIME